MSPQGRAEFGNGDALYAKAGELVGTSIRRSLKPARAFLQVHLEKVFKQSA